MPSYNLIHNSEVKSWGLYKKRRWALKYFLLLVLWVIVSALIVKNIHAENRGGLGVFGAMHAQWPCSRMIKGLEGLSEIRLSVLWNTFGTSFVCLDKIKNDPRPKHIQFHLVNEVCQRNNRCFPYEVLYGLTVSQFSRKLREDDAVLTNKIRTNVQPVAEWLHNNPQVQCTINPGLESNLGVAEYLKLRGILQPLFPGRCKWTWNPLNTNRYLKTTLADTVFEGHGGYPDVIPSCSVNFDGLDLNLKARPNKEGFPIEQVKHWLTAYSSCDQSYLWVNEFNGIGKGGFVDPRKRKNWPSSAIFSELNRELKRGIPNGAGVMPPTEQDQLGKAGCKTMISNHDGDKKDFLWKQSEPECCNRGAVTFLPRKYNSRKIDKNKVYVMKGAQKIATAYEQKVYTEDKSNRQFYRFRKTARDFPYNVVVHFDDICVEIRNPKIRND